MSELTTSLGDGLTFQSLSRKKFLEAFDLDTGEGLSYKPFNGQRTSVSQNFSLHENYRDEEPTEAGSDRAFGCTVGSILMLIGVTKAFVAGAISWVACLIFASGALLLLVGIVAPSRLSTLNRVWLKVGTVIAKVVNPVILALLFFLVVTPMAFFMRIVGKRPLGLAADRTATTYWIEREPPAGGASTMRRQF